MANKKPKQAKDWVQHILVGGSLMKAPAFQ